MSLIENSSAMAGHAPAGVSSRELPPELFRQLIDQSSDAIFVVDPPSSRILDVNQRACVSLGYQRARLLELRMTDIEVAYDGFSWPEQVQRVCAGELDILESGQRRKTGETFPVEITLKVVEAEQHSYIVAAARDITEKKQLESKFLRAQRLESIGRLAGGIAHDLNNVLSPVLLSALLLRQKVIDAEGREILDLMENSAKRGADMIRQILTFARGIKGQRMAVRLADLIGELMKMGRETFPRNIQLSASVGPDLWLVMGDATQLQQVLLNLCVNACDAMPTGGVLEVGAENCVMDQKELGGQATARPGPHVRITVKDTGTGIPPEVFERMFEPFFTTKEFGKGTGLGLATALGIVEAHGGFIRVETERGKGSRFLIHLPAQVSPAASGHDMVHPTLPRGRHELILVVDDEKPIRRVLEAILTAHGYEVVLAEDGAEAVVVYKQRQEAIRAVLMDMGMPQMDGPGAISAMRQINPRLPILALSGLMGSQQLAERIPDQRIPLLPKPCSAEQLLRGLAGVLSGAPPTTAVS